MPLAEPHCKKLQVNIVCVSAYMCVYMHVFVCVINVCVRVCKCHKS